MITVLLELKQLVKYTMTEWPTSDLMIWEEFLRRLRRPRKT